MAKKSKLDDRKPTKDTMHEVLCEERTVMYIVNLSN